MRGLWPLEDLTMSLWEYLACAGIMSKDFFNAGSLVNTRPRIIPNFRPAGGSTRLRGDYLMIRASGSRRQEHPACAGLRTSWVLSQTAEEHPACADYCSS